MADENSLLGTSGKETIPFDYQVEEQKIARKRALAQAMAQRGMTPQPPAQRFGLHVANPGILPHITQALQTYLGNKGLADADAEQTSMGQRMSAARQGDMGAVQGLANGTPGTPTPQAGPPMEGQPGLPDIMQGGQVPDPKAAIARAMTSQFGDIRAYGTQMQKDRQAQMMKVGETLGGADPVAGATFLQAGNLEGALPTPRAPAVTFGQWPGGGNFAVGTGNKGSNPTITAEPKPMNVNNSTSVGGKAEVELDKINMEQLSGARKEVADTPQLINNIQRIQTLLEKGADVGGGASLRQGMRQGLQMFGISLPEGGLTTELRSKLGENVIAQAKKLAPVTENDVSMLQQILGSIDTDPRALRELNAFMLAKALLTVDRHNTQVDDVSATNPALSSKYAPLKLNLPATITKASGALYGRAFQYMKEGGHDVSKYMYDGKPVSEIEFGVDFQTPTAANAPPPAGLRRK